MVEAAPAGPGPLRKTFLVPEIKPLDQYDFPRAKTAASLAWVLRAAFGGAEHVPSELWEPFYTDQYAQEHVKPPVTRLLLSAELYCRAWRLALPKLEAPPGPAALLTLLARRGLTPTLPDRPVREADLRHQPILMGAHLAVIDALMTAFATEWTASLPVPATPGSWEHKLLLWVDSTMRRLQELTEREAAQRTPVPPADSAAQPSIRYRKDRAVARRAPCFPVVSGLQDLASGAALAAIIHCYCPQLLRLEDVCLKDTMSVADSLYNLQLVQDFCAARLPGGCPLALEDLLYVPPLLKVTLVSGTPPGALKAKLGPGEGRWGCLGPGGSTKRAASGPPPLAVGFSLSARPCPKRHFTWRSRHRTWMGRGLFALEERWLLGVGAGEALGRLERTCLVMLALGGRTGKKGRRL